MKANKLKQESSPYLLQHAYNPVDWHPWGEEAFHKAKNEEKPILISIGYSACHWCHVMERECFEDENVAEQMNASFVCIKVDREERPDVDQIYMDALHAMGQKGGWPLNVFVNPDGKPFFGGTYFPKSRWIETLFNINNAYKGQREKIEETADEITLAINQSDIEKFQLQPDDNNWEQEEYSKIFNSLSIKFDNEFGGYGSRPKFPMPSVWSFLLKYSSFSGNPKALHHLDLTLSNIAFGGIYDQIGGGFARYSTDREWFIPHFEKMLYDNGQLISLYAEAYQLTGKELFRNTVYQTIEFVTRELTSSEGGFYSALDADSEGEEGKYYAWQFSELENLELPEKEWFFKYYNISPHGTWEYEKNIPFRTMSANDFCKKNDIDIVKFNEADLQWKKVLLKGRQNRIKPGLDDKIITSWNGLMLNGLIDAYRVFDKPEFLNTALKSADFISGKLKESNHLKHSYKDGITKNDGYLEDYAIIIKSFCNLYQATFDEKWLKLAEKLMKTCLDEFWDEKEGLFHFTSSDSEKLIARKKEIFDNVIPSSNSIMAENLIVLGSLLLNESFIDTGKKMVRLVQSLILEEPYFLSNWASVSFLVNYPMRQIVLSGEQAFNFRSEIEKTYLLNKVFAGTVAGSNLDLFTGRAPIGDKTVIYICEGNTCQLPLTDPQEAIKLLTLN